MPIFARNHCARSEIYFGDESPTALTSASRRASAPSGRLIRDSDKVQILKKYCRWLERGRPKADSPLSEICTTYAVHRHYPRKLYQKVLAYGSVENRFSGRARNEFSEETWEEMIAIIRSRREMRRSAPASLIRSELAKMAGPRTRVSLPSVSTIRRKKKAMGFQVHKTKTKPKLSKRMMAERLRFAERHKNYEFKRTIVLDEKWFTEEKGSLDRFEKRKSSPIKPRVAFRAATAETKTQLTKVMYLVAVCEGQKVGMYEMDWRGWQKLHGKKQTKGVNAEYFCHILKQVKRDCNRIFGQAELNLWVDLAPAHKARSAQETARRLFSELILQPPKSPDFNLCDAHIFPMMEKKVEAMGAISREEIRRACGAVWRDGVTKESLEGAAKRVRKNMLKVIEMGGDNKYDF
eukprot:scaffold6550_cov162-Pinguiococcus_pyrenoidosus.AAC.1